METILVTGSSGFIGFHTSKKLLENGYKVIGIDNENDYYDITLKQDRRTILTTYKNYVFYGIDITNLKEIEKVFHKHKPKYVINLAAQAGVTYSIENPLSYTYANIVGFNTIIELAYQYKVEKFIYASTGSVYGNNQEGSGNIYDVCDKPLSLYAATKKSNELVAHSYSHCFQMQTVGLRFFNVIGEWGRPDSALYLFTKNIIEDKPIKVRNGGNMQRNNTYVGDIVDGIIKVIDKNIVKKYVILNLGNETVVGLKQFIEDIEKNIGKKASIEYEDINISEIVGTKIDITESKEMIGWTPSVSAAVGIEKFIKRYKEYYNI